MNIQEAIHRVVLKESLSEPEMMDVMRIIMNGNATQAQLAGFLIGLRMKGETLDEITAAVKVMREMSEKVPVDVKYMVDTCGTGGDGMKTFNISTTSSFVAAAAGASIAKHGNRSVSSSSGSADVLEKAGVKIDLNASQVCQCIKEVGIGFMFAPMHHSAMRHVIEPRREMGVRTIFNILGPLTNPAGVKNQVIGVFDRQWMEPMAKVLSRLGSRHVLLVHSEEGLDEVSVSGKTYVSEMKEGVITSMDVSPDDFDLKRFSVDELSVDTPEQSLDMMWDVLSGKNKGAARNVVLLNAGAAIYVSGIAGNWKEGVLKAKQSIDSGKAEEKLIFLSKFSSAIQ